ncbi:beta-ketoacyl-ACP synthase [Aliterella atlantica]|uniref:3-oxoacyl-ACP synthase n=1 Tax=Aliterella atlantica CENA595 TaxID=1618023 RepID=A0A0D8ZWI0_9CYAN|nr:beta-ketoacyl-ACP synthase [Aliterella atlantica]KJH71596.1 3-oxoacyl-ACP synthase [Aliterella atlantica CENA595]
MVEVVVTGIGLVSPLGDSLEASWRQLLAGKSAIRLQQPFAELKQLPLALIGQQPVYLQALTRLVVSAAIADAGLKLPLTDCGVVVGSSRSQQATWERLARRHDRSEEWLNTLPHMNAIASARQIGASLVPVLAPMAACATGIWALFQGYELIKTGQCQRAIAGAAEAPVTPLTLAGFERMGALAQTGSYPFDLQRQGLVLGEGASVLVLESAELAKQRSARIYGQILSFGLSADAYYATKPDIEGKSAIAAVKQCLDRAQLSPTDIDYIHAHGTATPIGDRHEAGLISYLFPQVPVSSTKGATGHTLGASGALGAAFCLKALQQQLLPPCVGLERSEFDINLVTTGDCSKINRALCFSFGFGGQNAVMAVAKYE